MNINGTDNENLNSLSLNLSADDLALLGNISAFETDDNSETLESFFEQLMSLNILP